MSTGMLLGIPPAARTVAGRIYQWERLPRRDLLRENCRTNGIVCRLFL